MVADLALFEAGAPPGESGANQGPPGAILGELRRDILRRLEKGAVGTRRPNGSVTVRRSEPAGCVLYRPYLHLPQGRHRLTFSCRAGAPHMSVPPLLGLAILVLSRFQQQWRDFTIAELAGDSTTLDFDVPP